jgi:hypothetical protein
MATLLKLPRDKAHRENASAPAINHRSTAPCPPPELLSKRVRSNVGLLIALGI